MVGSGAQASHAQCRFCRSNDATSSAAVFPNLSCVWMQWHCVRKRGSSCDWAETYAVSTIMLYWGCGWFNVFRAKALGLPHEMLGASELNGAYRQILAEQRASGKDIRHLHASLEEMLQDAPCTLHPGRRCCIAARRGDVTLGVTGSPCNPYSTIRAKRFSDGSVAAHPMTQTTMSSVVAFYRRFEPRLGITEQVMGFGMCTSSNSAVTPLEQPLVCTEASLAWKFSEGFRLQVPGLINHECLGGLWVVA